MTPGFIIALIALVLDCVAMFVGRVPLVEGGLIGLVATSRLLP